MKSSNSTWKIIAKNTFTLFNLVNLILAIMVAAVGSYKNMLFCLIAIANTLISIINEIRAKKIVDKMRLLAEQNPTVIRNGQPFQVAPENVEKGDLMVLSLGDQVIFDSTIKEGTIEVNESFITGEQDNITKHQGDSLLSGSFVVAGTAKATVDAIGADNFVNKLQSEASHIKTADSKLFTLMNNIVKYISYALIPVGALLLWSRFRAEASTTDAVTSTVAALINMIPEGLILLTSSVLALATIRLSKRKVLVQDLYAIETLARVDCICLDKTGTLTTGNMKVKDLVLPGANEPTITFSDSAHATNPAEKSLLMALEAIFSHVPADNATSTALSQKFAKSAKNQATSEMLKATATQTKSHHAQPLSAPAVELIPFSSDRKYSGIRMGDTEYLIGATEFLLKDPTALKQAQSLKGIYRLLAVATRSVSAKNRAPKLLGFVRLEDEIRSDAPAIIQYFYDNQVAIKIISGDDLITVQDIAKNVGVRDLAGVDLSTIKNPHYASLIKKYQIFTRVRPEQKKQLVLALKEQGNTVAMTGDGVNDILAMKEADCSIAIGAGSDAARRAAKFVLLDSNFSAVPNIISEGRQSINNLERSTTLFLAKTVYASILAIIFVILPFSYPFSPVEMSLLNFTCIGFPAFILALEKNTDRIKDRFVTNIIEYSFPIGLTVSICMLALSIISHFQHFSRFELTTTSVFVTFAIDLILIYWISRPLNRLRATLLLVIIGIMAAAFLIPFIREFFEFTFLTHGGVIVTVAVIAAGILIFNLMKLLMRRIAKKVIKEA